VASTRSMSALGRLLPSERPDATEGWLARAKRQRCWGNPPALARIILRNSGGIDCALTCRAEQGIRVESIEPGKPTRSGSSSASISGGGYRGVAAESMSVMGPASGKPTLGSLSQAARGHVRSWGFLVSCKVEQLVREDVPFLEEGASVREAARLMAARNVGSGVSRATARVGAVTGAAADLFREAHTLLFGPGAEGEVDHIAAQRLHQRLRAFQSTYKRLKWGPVRIVQNRDLLLV
jgi:hypothetical protein